MCDVLDFKYLRKYDNYIIISRHILAVVNYKITREFYFILIEINL